MVYRLSLMVLASVVFVATAQAETITLDGADNPMGCTLSVPNIAVAETGSADDVTLYANTTGGWDSLTVQATGNLVLGDGTVDGGVRLGYMAPDFSSATTSTLEVGQDQVSLASAGLSQIYAATLAGGQLGSTNGIKVASFGSITGYGQMSGYFECAESGGLPVSIQGDAGMGGIVIRDSIRGIYGLDSVTLLGAELGSFSPAITMATGTDLSAAKRTMLVEGPNSGGLLRRIVGGKPYDGAYKPATPVTTNARTGGYSQYLLYKRSAAGAGITAGGKSAFNGQFDLTTVFAGGSYLPQSGDIFTLIQCTDYVAAGGLYCGYTPNLAVNAAGQKMDWSTAVVNLKDAFATGNYSWARMPDRRDGGFSIAVYQGASYTLPGGWANSGALAATNSTEAWKTFDLNVGGITAAPVADWYATNGNRYLGNGLGMFNGNWAYFNTTVMGIYASAREVVFHETTNAKFAGVKIGGNGTYSLFRSTDGLNWGTAIASLGNADEKDFLTYTVSDGAVWTGTGITGGTDYFKLVSSTDFAGLTNVGLVFDREGAASFTMTAVAVPEPATLAMLAMGLVALVWYRRRTK